MCQEETAGGLFFVFEHAFSVGFELAAALVQATPGGLAVINRNLSSLGRKAKEEPGRDFFARRAS